ncbi:cucumisin-like [Olea europaea subsp. europaea]|uniref:Cucumisin-like n=1 Tax=Olea europaea subsp. europaea TaxID=158383 RepID=A0A8S0TU05_OLEEU|nr:cucumisin-like [Olea europaea subsp. europaea]
MEKAVLVQTGVMWPPIRRTGRRGPVHIAKLKPDIPSPKDLGHTRHPQRLGPLFKGQACWGLAREQLEEGCLLHVLRCPDPESITNLSPWSLSIAASDIDRKFLTQVQLGNGKTYEGVAVNTFNLKDEMYSLVYGGKVPAQGFDGSESRYCDPDTLDKKTGKWNQCPFTLGGGEQPLVAGVTRSIMQDDRIKDFAFSFRFSASYLGMPALCAPGIDIVAAWSEATTVTGLEGDTIVVPYKIISRTSMSCPHATASVAYVKSFNPT